VRGGLAQVARDARGKGEREAVVAYPGLEEVAEDVQRVAARDDLGEETLELRDDPGPGLVEMQVRDEQRAAQARSTFSITTGVVGTFWWPPEFPVATFLILSTTSLPSTTLPNTA
jgi:hypothetical protein